ncbi:glycosyltransferase family 39 protein [Thermosulfurimonas sp. F29]|uniref:ArnT family glycosyltransferase n=1 Tax=Thermosulfurimonas sp. F29 TaxID=2867247 RepID=UPI001C831EC8|nr:glycosyltransferase family 39 protein [Thermosulfurimonas sp. F29]MBX6422830.1 glycosyltransferase family 39 protein [Thermosulfurimonas sp. F29]
MKREGKILILFGAGVLVFLFLNLGDRPLWGVEGRWAEGVREMMLRGDWWVPTINGVPHITKPLIPYWLIRFSASLFGGLNEFTVRLPVVLCALATLLAFYALAGVFLERYWALVATGMLATSWGFVAYARVAQSEIYQLAGITAALAFYFRYRERTSLVGYLGFWFSAVFAALSKGLPGLAVPVLTAAVDLARHRNPRHLNAKNLLAAGTALAVYLGHYYALSRAVGSELPFHLFVRENLLQAVSPYDNREPFYVYFLYVPELLLPWTPFFLMALAWGMGQWRNLSERERLVLLSIAAVFLLFTLARARRSYYILPILPFCVLLTSTYLSRVIRTPGRYSLGLFYLYGALTFFAGVALCLAPFIWGWLSLPPLSLRLKLAVTLAGMITTVSLVLCVLRSTPPWGLIFSYLAMAVVGLSVLTPTLTPPSEKAFGRELARLARARGETPCALGKVSANLFFYLEWPGPIPVFQTPEDWPSRCRMVFFRESLYRKETLLGTALREKGFRVYGLADPLLSRDTNKNYLLAVPGKWRLKWPFRLYP